MADTKPNLRAVLKICALACWEWAAPILRPVGRAIVAIWRGVIVPVGIPLVVAAGGVYYQYWVSQPKLTGQILFIARGQLETSSGSLNVMTVFVYLANGREIPVTPVEIAGEYLNTADKWVPLGNLYEIGNGSETLTLQFERVQDGRPLWVRFGAKKYLLVRDIAVPILRDKPRGGLVQFGVPRDMMDDMTNRENIRLRVTDATGAVHQILRSRFYDPATILSLFPEAEMRRSPFADTIEPRSIDLFGKGVSRPPAAPASK